MSRSESNYILYIHFFKSYESFYFAIDPIFIYPIVLLNCITCIRFFTERWNEKSEGKASRILFSASNRINSERTIRRNHGGGGSRNSRQVFLHLNNCFLASPIHQLRMSVFIRRPKVVYCWVGTLCYLKYAWKRELSTMIVRSIERGKLDGRNAVLRKFQ